MLRVATGVWALVLASAASAPDVRSAGANEPQGVSLLQLIATPERYEGKRVLVEGFCHFAFEEHSLYLHREDSDLLNVANAVWLDTPGAHEALTETFVRVEGVFTAKEHGHLGAWPGELQSITRFERARTRRDYEKTSRDLPKPGGKPR
jgi:hypothetical protein